MTRTRCIKPALIISYTIPHTNRSKQCILERSFLGRQNCLYFCEGRTNYQRKLMHHSTLSWNFQGGGKTQMMSEESSTGRGVRAENRNQIWEKKEKETKGLPERRENKGTAEQHGETKRREEGGGQVQIVSWVKQWVTDSPEWTGCENEERVEHSAVGTASHILLSAHTHTHLNTAQLQIHLLCTLFLQLIHKNGSHTRALLWSSREVRRLQK